MEPIKVICVNVPKEWVAAKRLKNIDHPSILDECLVVEIKPHSFFGCDMYRLQGFVGATFAPENFALLPGQTATELNIQELEAIIK